MSRIPVVLVTGFLGSGKTTLLHQLARSHPDWRLVFLVNEYAETSVDGETLAATGSPTQSVVGGSLFCECKASDFIRTMKEQVLGYHRDSALDAVVIETSGTADPEAIGKLMTDHGLAVDFELRSIVTVVAPARLKSLLANLPVVESQLQSSDLIVINKIDTVEESVLPEIEAAIRTVNASARIVRADHCRFDFFLPQSLPAAPTGELSTCDANPFSTKEVEWPAERSLAEAKIWLQSLPQSILRIKGRIQTPEGIWHVERTVDSLSLEETGEGPNRLVLIAHDDHEEDLEKATPLKTPSSQPVTTFGLIACDVFTDEIEAFASQNETRWKSLQLLEMGLHDQPDRLRKDIENQIAEVEADPEIQAIALAYGRCGNGLVGVHAGRVPLILPQAHDCISILLGGKDRHDALLRDNPATYFYSPGWVREKRVPGPDREAYLRELYGERFEDDEEMIEDLIEVDREMFAHHNCAAYVSITESPHAREYCRDCAKFLGWKHHEPPCDEGFLHALLSGEWQGDLRFVIIHPGEKIGADSEGSLITEAATAP